METGTHFYQDHSFAFAALRRYVRGFGRRRPRGPGACELCAAALREGHEHLLDVPRGRMVCACESCVSLFARRADAIFRRVPRRVRLLREFRLTDAQWVALAAGPSSLGPSSPASATSLRRSVASERSAHSGAASSVVASFNATSTASAPTCAAPTSSPPPDAAPPGVAFFFYSTPRQRMASIHLTSTDIVAAPLPPDAWRDLEAANPALREMLPDVEALLIRRRAEPPARPALAWNLPHAVGYLVPIDECHRLVGLLRAHQRDAVAAPVRESVGATVVDPSLQRQIDQFFDDLRNRATLA